MDTSLLKNYTEIKLPGAIVFHNQDRTHAKAFVGEGEEMLVKGVSTDEKWQPDALEQVFKWLKQQGIETEPDTEVEA